VLFFPLNLYFTLLVLLFLLIASFLIKENILMHFRKAWEGLGKQPAFFFLCLAAFLFTILSLNAGPTVMDDTDSYHIQMIKWAQEYGTVPGIANLHLRFGFNSSWFISIGLLSPRFDGINSYLSLNGLLSLWICYYLLEKFFSFSMDRPPSKNMLFAMLVILALCLINWPMIRGNATNSNYDFITTFCILVLFFESRFSFKALLTTEFILWPCYMFTIRMINYPLLLLSVYGMVMLYKSDKIKPVIIYALIASFIIVPFLIRNTILSGYPFFPIYQLDFFHFDWKADRQKMIEISEYIKYFNRVTPVYQPLDITSRLNFPEWIIPWYKSLFRFDRVITTLSLLCYLILFIRQKKILAGVAPHIKFFLCVMVLQLVSWFFTAPDPRFVYGPLLIAIFILVYSIPLSVVRISSSLMKSISVCLSACMIGYTANKIIINTNYRNWITPRHLPVPAITKVIIGKIELNIPGKVLNNWNPRCYDITLPCLYRVDPRLEARGKNIKYGFRLADSSSTRFPGGEYKIEP